MIKVDGYAASDATSPLAPFRFERREPGARDVQIQILDLKAVAPLLCAGITTYSPLKHWSVGPDFCAKHGVVSDIEMIPIQKVNEAYARLLKNDVKYRFVIDMASLS